MVNMAVARVMVSFVERSRQGIPPQEKDALDLPVQGGLWMRTHAGAVGAWIALVAALRPDVGPIV